MMFLFYLLLVTLVTLVTPFNYTNELIISSHRVPTVLMHGILSNQDKMADLKLYLEINFNIDVIVPEIGNGIVNSFNIPLSKQGDILCQELNTNPLLENGFNFIGVSQGGILGRYYIEKCGVFQVYNFITLVSPHGGVYRKDIADIINMYGKYAIEHYSFSSYWRDPFNYMKYKDLILLAELNNEVITEESVGYRNRFASINNFVMVYSPLDGILNPPESGKFYTFDINSTSIIPLKETTMYESLGLNVMNDMNKIHIYKTNCSHHQHKDFSCFKQLYDMFKQYIS